MGWDGASVLRSRRRQTGQTTTHPGKGGELCLGFLRARKGRGSERMEEWREEPALWRCARASDSLPGGGLAGGGRRASWVVCGNAGGGTQKVRGWQSPKIAWSEVVGRLFGRVLLRAPPKKMGRKRRKGVFGTWPCLFVVVGSCDKEGEAVGWLSRQRVSRTAMASIPSRRLPDRLSRPGPDWLHTHFTATSAPRRARSCCAK